MREPGIIEFPHYTKLQIYMASFMYNWLYLLTTVMKINKYKIRTIVMSGTPATRLLALNAVISYWAIFAFIE